MTKNELIQEIADRHGLTLAEAARRLDQVLTTITDVVVASAEGEQLRLPGLGTLTHVTYAEKRGLNPATSERITIPARSSIRFRMSADLKRRIRKGTDD